MDPTYGILSTAAFPPKKRISFTYGGESGDKDPFADFKICAMVKSRVFLGMGDLPPLIGILIMGI